MAILTIPACSHQRPERHAHWDDGVPVLHVEPIPARLRQLRVVIQELEQDDDEVVTPRPDPGIVDTSKTKAQIWAKGTPERAIHRTEEKNETSNYRKISRKGIFPITVLY